MQKGSEFKKGLGRAQKQNLSAAALIIEKLRAAPKNRKFGTLGVGCQECKAMTAGEAKHLLYWLLRDLAIELHIPIQQKELFREIWGDEE